MASFSEMVARKEAVEAHYLGLPGVTGIDVGFKEVGGHTTGELAIRVHVAEKKGRLPEGQRVPADIDGIVTDVLQRKYEPQVASEAVDAVAQADTTHYATLQGGISMGPSRVIGGSIFAGTLGAVVIDRATNQHAALTNFHVACVDSSWNVGDRMVQPSRIDTGVVPGGEFGAILRATLSSAVDGGLISIDVAKSSTCDITEIGKVRGTKVATLGMSVRKRGRTTGLTFGSVDGLSATVNIDYGDGIGIRMLTNQVSIKTDTARNPLFSDHGDSGSVIVDGAGFVVALLFAGAGTGTLGNPIAAVLAELNITMCIGKAVIKDIKDGRKDFIKDKELRKEVIKEKELRKEVFKDKELRKEIVADNKGLKDVVDNPRKRIGDTGPVPGPPGPDPWRPRLPIGPLQPGPAGLDDRLAAMESQLAALTSFISGELRPDLSTGALAGEPDLSDEDLEGLRAELAQQAEDAVAAKAEFDAPWA